MKHLSIVINQCHCQDDSIQHKVCTNKENDFSSIVSLKFSLFQIMVQAKDDKIEE